MIDKDAAVGVCGARSRRSRRFSVIRHLPSAIFVLITLSGCASLARSVFATPTVQLKDVRMKAIGFQGGSLELVLMVYNPNDYRLDATRLTYNLWVDTLKLAYGEINKTVTLEPHKQNEVIVPVSFSIQELVKASQVMSKTGGVDYRVAGEVTAATPAASFTRPYEGKGHFDDLSSLRPR
jgi:LEA14-like dessication related protein